MHCNVVSVHILPGKIEEFMLVLPPNRVLLELLSLTWWWRRVGDLGNEICRRRLCETVDEDANQRNLDKDIEAKTETKEHTRTILEP